MKTLININTPAKNQHSYENISKKYTKQVIF